MIVRNVNCGGGARGLNSVGRVGFEGGRSQGYLSNVKEEKTREISRRFININNEQRQTGYASTKAL
jgi:hypothetical protein